MKKRLSTFVMLIFLSACSAPFVLMANPKSGETVECSGVGVGLIHAIAVSNQVENCVTQYQRLGYVRADQLTEEQKATLKLHPPIQEHRTVIQRPD